MSRFLPILLWIYLLAGCYDTHIGLNKSSPKKPLTIDSVDDLSSEQIDELKKIDSDSDGLSDYDEIVIGTNPTIDDTDGDGEGDALDAFPLDPDEFADTDGDGVGNNSDEDDDNDGLTDIEEQVLGTNPLLEDTDADSYSDLEDAFPTDAKEWSDLDGDGIGDNTDVDLDGDGIVNEIDPFPTDPSEWLDTDGDGIGNNADEDDDGDGLKDSEEAEVGSNPLVVDTDGDGYNDFEDALPTDPNEWIDTDGDGVGNNTDTDDDGDGLSDIDEIASGSDPLVVDTDGDGFIDGEDAFVLDETEWLDTDGDGTGDNADTDDDGDGLTDEEEGPLGTDPKLADTDGDGLIDSDDPFPTDASKTNPAVIIESVSAVLANSDTTIVYSLKYLGAETVSLTSGDVGLSYSGDVTCIEPVSVVDGNTKTPSVFVDGCDGNGDFTLSITAGTSNYGVSTDEGVTADPVVVDNIPPTVSIGSPSQGLMSSEDTVTYPVTYEISPSGFGPFQVKILGDNIGCTANTRDILSNTPKIDVSGCKALDGSISVAVIEGASQDLAGNFDLGDDTSDPVSISNPPTYTPDPSDFITVWKTTTSNETVVIPTSGGSGFNYVIDWGDGTIEGYSDGSPSHVYTTPGDYTVRISGLFPNFKILEHVPSASKLIRVENLGKVGWQSLNGAFQGAQNLESFIAGETDTSVVGNMASMFKSTPSLTSADLRGLDTSFVSTMKEMFRGASSIEVAVLASFDTSNVTDLSGMFRGTKNLSTLDLSTFNTVNVVSLEGMFTDASSLTALDLSHFNTSKVRSVKSLFNGASKLDFVNLNNWDVSSVVRDADVFNGTPSLGSSPNKKVYCNIAGDVLFGQNCLDITAAEPLGDIVLSMDGTDGDTTFIDTSSNAYPVTTFGNAVISGSDAKFGQSAYFDGSGDYLQLAHNENLTFEGEFTIDFWGKNLVDSGYRPFFELGIYTDGMLLRAYGSGEFHVNTPNLGDISSYTTLNTWHHYAITRDSSNTIRLFIDGVERVSGNVTGILNNAAGVLRLASATHTTNQFLQGYIDEFRIVKGEAKWTSNFTPFNEPYADMAVTTDLDGDGIPDNRDLDKDGDGLSDSLESILGTDPLLADTDSDGLSDFEEYLEGYDPLVYTNVPPELEDIEAVEVVTDEVRSGIPIKAKDRNGNLSCPTALSASSSNPAVIENSSVVFSGTWPNCEMTVTPKSGASGFSEITVTVSDGSLSSSKKFFYYVSVVPPTVTVGTPVPSAITSAMQTVFPITYQFVPTSLDASKIKLEGQSIGCSFALVGENTLTPSVIVGGCRGEGDLMISVEAGTSQNGDGVPDKGTTSPAVLVDNSPAKIIIGPPSVLTVDVSTPVTYELTFEGIPSGFDDLDVIVVGASEGCSVSIADPETLTPEVTVIGCSQNGYAAINIAGGSSSDLLGNVDIGAGPSEYVEVSNYPDGWFQEAYIKAANASVDDYFGQSVSLSGDTVAVTAHLDDENLAVIVNGTTAPNNGGALESGAVYVYKRTGNNWEQQAYIKGSNNQAYHYFGNRVSISGNTLAVGHVNDDSNSRTIVNGTSSSAGSAGASGAVFIYERTGDNWVQQAFIKALNADGGDRFGANFSLSGNTLAVGAYDESEAYNYIVNGTVLPNANNSRDSGAVYIYRRNGSVWSHESYIKARNRQNDEEFGASLSLSGDTLAVGLLREDSNQLSITNGTDVSFDNSTSDTGAVYVYKRRGTIWAQEAYIKGSSLGNSDYFGVNVTLSNNLLAVGATGEDSGATTIVNGSTAPTDQSVWDSGAVYIFERSPTGWEQQAFIKSVNRSNYDNFGSSLSLSSSTLAVGVKNEDSSGSTIINGTTADASNGAAESGAVYIYKRTGGVWAQESYIKPANTNIGDEFGISVSLSGDTLAVGARYEDSSTTTIINGANASLDNGKSNSGAVYIYRHGIRMFEVSEISAEFSAADQLDINWVMGNLGTGISVKIVYQSGNSAPVDCNSGTEVYSGAGNTTSISGLSSDTGYSFRICTFDGTSYSEGTTFSRNTEESIPPNVLSISRLDASPTEANTVRYGVTFDEPVSGLSEANFSTNDLNGTIFSQITSVTGHNDYYIVTLVLVGNGEVRLDLSDVTGVVDAFGNQVASTFLTGETYVRSNSGWYQQAFLKASNAADGDGFGDSIAIFGAMPFSTFCLIFGVTNTSLTLQS